MIVAMHGPAHNIVDQTEGLLLCQGFITAVSLFWPPLKPTKLEEVCVPFLCVVLHITTGSLSYSHEDLGSSFSFLMNGAKKVRKLVKCEFMTPSCGSRLQRTSMQNFKVNHRSVEQARGVFLPQGTALAPFSFFAASFQAIPSALWTWQRAGNVFDRCGVQVD